MLSNYDHLQKKTGENGIGRLPYLQSLVTEFEETTSQGAKQEVLANLANFAYDPINYGYFTQLNVVDMFLDSLEEEDEKLVEFAAAGLCNCCLDERTQQLILQNGGVSLLKKHCLSGVNEETVISALTCLLYLSTNADSSKDILSEEFVQQIVKWSTDTNTRIRNLATIFKEDYIQNNTNKEEEEAEAKMREKKKMKQKKTNTVGHRR
ncbi:armadillo repeat-containing protein 7-like [Argonauta hians]